MTRAGAAAAPRRLKVLIAAYACGPSDQPEASAGWAFATAAAAEHEVWIMTRKIWIPAIRAALDGDRALARHLHVVGIDLPQALIDRYRHPWDMYWYYSLWQAKLAIRARDLHRTIGFDVAHHVTFANDWLPSGLGALREVPLVWGPVGGATRIPVWRLRRWLGARGVAHEAIRAAATTLPRAVWGDANARRASLVIAQNGDVAHRFRRAARVVVEPNAALDTAALPQRTPDPRSPRVEHEAVFVGRLIPLKGLTIALHALARPGAAGWRLTVYGDGPLRTSLEAMASSLGVADRVRFAGHVPRNEVLAAMAAADALLFPSMHDQAGWAVAEASSMGTPVVCLPLGGPPVLAAPNGLVAGLEGDIVGNVVEQLQRTVGTTGIPHERWSRDRLPHLVEDWYRDAISRARRAHGAEATPTLRVLESVGAIRPTTNPYLAQLIAGLGTQTGVTIAMFSFPRAIFGRYDLFHVHWPEVLFGGHRRSGRLVRRALTSVVLARLIVTRTPIVRTWHNLARPEGLSRWDHLLLDLIDHRTGSVIRLNDSTPVPLQVPVHTIPHGHYRDWFDGLERPPALTGRVVYVGLIRRYKGVERLISAFADCRSPGATLEVAGKPTSDALATALEGLSAREPRVRLTLRFLDDEEFVRAISSASLVVLPYRDMHNSGTVLAALSLERPVLVPANQVNEALSIEVGEGWVHRFSGELTAQHIDDALAAGIPDAPPRLEDRAWSTGARAHVDAFRDLIGQP